MNELIWKMDLRRTAAVRMCQAQLRWLSPWLGKWAQGALTLILVVSVGAQTLPTTPASASSPASASVTPSASETATDTASPLPEQPTAWTNPSAPVSSDPITQADPVLPASQALGHSVQAPTAPSSPSPSDPNAWLSLSKRHQQALAPLAEEWHELTAQQRQTWLTVSKNFFERTDEEQQILHSRMREWAALSPRQRSQARFQFNATQSLSTQNKRAQWEAYQALSEKEKKKLSSGPKPPAKSAARSFAPPSNRLVSPPLLPVNATRAVQRVAPSKPIHPKTLLPQPS